MDKGTYYDPYTTKEAIEEYMDIKFTGTNGGIDMLDDRFLLVFVDNKTVKLSIEEVLYNIEERND